MSDSSSSPFFGRYQRSAASTLLTAPTTPAVDDPSLTPGMKAALAAGPHSKNEVVDIALWGGLNPLRKNASPLQDIAAALKLGRAITAADWLKAGFGPGGISLDAKAPTIGDADIQAAAEAARKGLAQSQGRTSTILTSGLGDTSPIASGKKTLLGA